MVSIPNPQHPFGTAHCLVLQLGYFFKEGETPNNPVKAQTILTAMQTKIQYVVQHNEVRHPFHDKSAYSYFKNLNFLGFKIF